MVKEKRDMRVKELEEQLSNQKYIAENSAQEYNRSVGEYNHGPYRDHYSSFGPQQ